MAHGLSGSRICVVANRSKTWFYCALIDKMGLDRADVYWIVTGKPWLKVLQEAGYADENILYYEVAKQESEMDLTWLAQLEQSMSMPVWRLIGSDRFLSQRTDHPDRFLNRLGQVIERFLAEHSISHCFGEATWSVELLAYYIAQRAATPYLTPHTIRIPSERFAFFTDPFQSDFVRRGTRQDDWEHTYRSVVEEMVEEGSIPRPYYWYVNNQVPAVRLSYLRKFARFLSDDLFGQARTEYMDYTLTERIKNKLRMIRNRRQIAGLPFETTFPTSSGHQYALFTLHKQPEASIDVMGGIHSNQQALIEILSQSLPLHTTLLVKEHSNAIGDRGDQFYRRILSRGSVRLVDPWLSIHELLRNVDVVFSVSGTVGMEASLLGKKAIMFCPTFFTRMPNVHFVDDLSSVDEALNAPLIPHKTPLRKSYEDLISNSYAGMIGDPVCFPAAMAEENLQLVADAFAEILAETPVESVSRA